MALFALCLVTSAAAGSGATDESARELVRRSQAAVHSDPRLSRTLAEQALAELARHPDPDLEVTAHWVLCDYHSERDPSAAARHLTTARALLPQVKRTALAASLLGCEGDLSELNGDSQRAMTLYEQAVSVAEKTADQEILANALFQRGYLRGVRGDFAAGLMDLRRANQIFERIGLPQKATTATNAVATLYNRMGDHAQARHYFEIALQAQLAAGLKRESIVTRHNLGRSLENMKDWDGARAAFEAVLADGRELGYLRGEAYGLRGLASVSNAQQKWSEALSLLDRASILQSRAPDERLRGQILLQRGIALRGLKRLAESHIALTDALKVFLGADSQAEIALTYGELAATQAALGDFRAAYESEKKYKAVSDQLYARQLDDRFSTLKVEFDTAAKDKENLLLQREKAATERALAQARKVNTLRAVALALAGLLVIVLAILVGRHRRTSRRMRDLAMTDELTDLPNRRHVLGELDALIQAGNRAGVLIVDLDRFKPINDDHGHLVGDAILRAVAACLLHALPAGALLGRLGGEEFIVVLPSTDAAAAHAAAERLRLSISALDVSRWLPDRGITISIGVTACGPGEEVSAVLRRADEALYEAKRSGRDCTRVNPGSGTPGNAHEAITGLPTHRAPA